MVLSGFYMFLIYLLIKTAVITLLITLRVQPALQKMSSNQYKKNNV